MKQLELNKTHYKKLQITAMVLILIVGSIPPFLLGFGFTLVTNNAFHQKVSDQLATSANLHALTVERYLQERLNDLQTVINLYSFSEISTHKKLETVFTALTARTKSYTDLGVIDDGGYQVGYMGPFALTGKLYRDSEWFREVLQNGIYISDVFLGYRQSPHFIVAIRKIEDNRSWILRGTINTEVFNSTVEKLEIGTTGEAFIVNRKGEFQTIPRHGGELMEIWKEPVFPLTPFKGTRISQYEASNGRRLIVAGTWIRENKWLLVVNQEQNDAYAVLKHVQRFFIVIVATSALMILLLTIVAARVLINRIEKLDLKRAELDRQLLAAGKLASIGEMASGIAHEINNPLAIISSERTNISDLLDELNGSFPARGEMKDSLERIKRQIERCKGITHKMLQFARGGTLSNDPIQIKPFLEEMVQLISQRARNRSIEIITHFEELLPAVRIDPVELQQVIMNLFNNAIHAIDKKGAIHIHTFRRNNSVCIQVHDTGKGIPEENLSKIFTPFFTTKPPGEGTGLGLSVTYGIVTQAGGRIDVQSVVGEGTTFTILIPPAVINKP